MQAAALVVKLRDGGMVAKANESVSAMLTLAQEVRVSGLCDGQAVERGCVLKRGAIGGVVREFVCDASPATAQPAPRRRGR